MNKPKRSVWGERWKRFRNWYDPDKKFAHFMVTFIGGVILVVVVALFVIFNLVYSLAPVGDVCRGKDYDQYACIEVRLNGCLANEAFTREECLLIVTGND